jgi:hypothetical protein
MIHGYLLIIGMRDVIIVVCCVKTLSKLFFSQQTTSAAVRSIIDEPIASLCNGNILKITMYLLWWRAFVTYETKRQRHV